MVIYIYDFLGSVGFRMDIGKLNGLSFDLTCLNSWDLVAVRNAWLTRPHWPFDNIDGYPLSFLFYRNDVWISYWRIRTWSLIVKVLLHYTFLLVNLWGGDYLIVAEYRIILFLKIQMRRRPHIVNRLSVKFQFIDPWNLMSLINWSFSGC